MDDECESKRQVGGTLTCSQGRRRQRAGASLGRVVHRLLSIHAHISAKKVGCDAYGKTKDGSSDDFTQCAPHHEQSTCLCVLLRASQPCKSPTLTQELISPFVLLVSCCISYAKYSRERGVVRSQWYHNLHASTILSLRRVHPPLPQRKTAPALQKDKIIVWRLGVRGWLGERHGVGEEGGKSAFDSAK
jgi:hypothetical protein